MRVEIINTGTELLLGHVQNSHLVTLAESLFAIGLRVERQVTVPDGAAIVDALREARERGGLLVVTGGLGPTSDDITREATCAVFNRTMTFRQETWDPIAAYFAKRGFSLDDPQMEHIQKKQAMVADGARVLPNFNGTAPGWILDDEPSQCVVVLLPGPPKELRPMWEEGVLPWLRERVKATVGEWHEIQFRVFGIGEPKVQLAVEADVLKLGVEEVGYCARPSEVDLRLLARHSEVLKPATEFVYKTLGEAIYAEGVDLMETVVVRLAQKMGRKLATAESCTGGLIAHRITSVSGSSDVFDYGWVTYANRAKMSELEVPEELLNLHGAVSEPVARAMAEGALRRSGSDLAVAVTGIAGPTGGTDLKPVGLVFIALAERKGGGEIQSAAQQKSFVTDRETFKYLVSQHALNWMRLRLIRITSP